MTSPFLNLSTIIGFQQLPIEGLILDKIDDVLSQSVNKSFKLKAQNCEIVQAVYPTAEDGFNFYLQSIADTNPEIASALIDYTVEDLIEKTIEPLIDSVVDPDGQYEDFELAVSEYPVALLLTMDESGNDYDQLSLSYFVEVTTSNDEDEEEYVAVFIATFCINPSLLVNDSTTKIIARKSVDDQLLHFSLIHGIIHQRFAENITLLNVDEESELEVVSFATLDNEDETAARYIKFLSILNTLVFYNEKNPSRLYQSIIKRYPLTTIADVNDAFMDNTYPLLDSTLVSMSDLDSMLDLGIDTSDDDEHDYVETFVIAPQLAFEGETDEDVLDQITFDAIGFNFETTLFDPNALKRVTVGEFGEDEESPILLIGDISINPDFAPWWQTLLIPFVRLQMEKYDSVDDLDHEVLLTDFARYVEESM